MNEFYQSVNIMICGIVGFFEVLKFRGFDRFMKFKPSKNLSKLAIYCREFGLIALDHMSLSGWPFVKIKTENEAFAEFKYLENNQLAIW